MAVTEALAPETSEPQATVPVANGNPNELASQQSRQECTASDMFISLIGPIIGAGFVVCYLGVLKLFLRSLELLNYLAR
jgi:hypothetical protein